MSRRARINLGDVGLRASVTVTGSFHPGFRGSREEPAEPAGFDIETIVAHFGGKSIDVTSSLSEREMESIAAKCMEAR